MDCSEARRLLEQGITPGSRSPQRAALGFHLASCVACRAYQAQLQDVLLAQMLGIGQASLPAPAETVTSAPTPVVLPESSPAVVAKNRSSGTWLWYGGLAVLAVVLCLVLGAVWMVGSSLWRIHNNYQSFYVPPAAAAVMEATAEPSAAPTSAPTLTPTLMPTLMPTLTPLPTATPTLTPLPTATPVPAPPSGGPVTVLLLGSDRRPGEGEPSRTDAVVVARIDPERQRIALLSLPRDLIVNIPNYGYARINAANVYGYTGELGSGAQAAKQAVSELLGIPVDYYLYIDFEGFIEAIDSLGGVPVEVTTELYDPEFPTMDYGYTIAYFEAGHEVMDGQRALMYSRIRHPDSDFARMRRQQAVLVGVLERLEGDNVAESLERLADVTTALRGYVLTDIPEERMIGLAWAMRTLGPGSVERYLLDSDQVSFGSGSDQWAEVALPGALEGLVSQLLGQ